MNEVIAKEIQHLKEQIKKVKSFEEDVNILQKLIPKASFWFDYEINISQQAKSFTEVKQILKGLAEKRIFLISYQKSDTCPIWKLNGKTTTIRMTPNWTGDENAQCKLVQVGEKEVTSVEPIYKLVCDEGEEMK